MNRSIGFIFFLAILVTGGINAQKKEYTYKFSSVKLLENPAINSYAEEIYPLYDRTYDTLFFVRSHHNENIGRDKVNQDIWYCYKDGGTWSDPINFKAMNNAENNSIVGMANNEERLYLLNSYTSNLVRDYGIVYTDYIDGEWSKPLTIDLKVNTQNNFYSFFINHLEDVVLITMFNTQSEGEEDLFVSLRSEDGHWREPIYMGHTVNSEGFETSPFLTDDKMTLFFSSNGFSGYGESDIYMSRRLSDSWNSWTEPENLGNEVNSEKFDGYFSIYENGEFLYASNRDSKFSDIFTGKWEKVEVIKEEPKIEKPVVEVKQPAKLSLPETFSVYFDNNSSYFDKAAYGPKLKLVTDFLVKNPKVAIIIEGHTDHVGDEDYNLFLSLKRAKSVSAYIKSGDDSIADSRIIVVPNGEEQSNQTDKDASRKVSVRYIVLD